MTRETYRKTDMETDRKKTREVEKKSQTVRVRESERKRYS